MKEITIKNNKLEEKMIINKKHVKLQREKMQELWVNDSLNLAGRELIEELLDAILELLEAREVK